MDKQKIIEELKKIKIKKQKIKNKELELAKKLIYAEKNKK